jgi:spore coat protein A, manganese oxidase
MTTRRKLLIGTTATAASSALIALATSITSQQRASAQPGASAPASTPTPTGHVHTPGTPGAPAHRHGIAAPTALQVANVIDPLTIPMYQMPLVIPPAMPKTPTAVPGIDYYEIAVRQFEQQILPTPLPTTKVWSYGSIGAPTTFNYPAFTIEATYQTPTHVKWINQLVDANGAYLPHILPVDQTIHWANPPGGLTGRDGHGTRLDSYAGPVPIVTHVHGAHTNDDSDGYAEAWYLPVLNPAANPGLAGYATVGTWYDKFKQQIVQRTGVVWEPGSATFVYPNAQRAATLWYHDHTLGMTRVNVYAGPAGFYILRGGPDDAVGGTLPGPGPTVGSNPFGTFYEIPIAIQDRAFNTDGSLFYPDNRAYFEGLNKHPVEPFLNIPFSGQVACDGQPSDVSPIWNPEFFGNTIVVNGRTWPYLEVEPRRYRFRLLNGCQARYLILHFSDDRPIWQIGAEGGFLPAPVQHSQLLMSPAERADVIVDFSDLTVGQTIELLNLGPDEPYNGTNAPIPSNRPTGKVMQFRVVPATGADPSTPPNLLTLPTRTPLGLASVTRQISLNELDSTTVKVSSRSDGSVVLDCSDGEFFGPTEARLGTVSYAATAPVGVPLRWMDEITEDPVLGATEIWEIYNFTVDAHPIHIHEVMFEVVNRQPISGGPVRPPAANEMGVKDTVTAYPGEITRVKSEFDIPGRFVWHCHIVEHEDNEMMRPYDVVASRLWVPQASKG